VDWSAFDACLIRTTWDYMERREAFVNWAERTARLTCLFNPPTIVRWNTHKAYLRELEQRGVPTVPTAWLPRGSTCDLGSLRRERGWSDLFIKPAVGPDGAVPMGTDDSALRAGQGDFDANGTVKCAQAAGQPMTDCAFGVARASGGYATVVVTRPDGRTRAIFFQLGIAVGADTSQADGYPEFAATRNDDITIVSVGTERYEIFDAVVLGG